MFLRKGKDKPPEEPKKAAPAEKTPGKDKPPEEPKKAAPAEKTPGKDKPPEELKKAAPAEKTPAGKDKPPEEPKKAAPAEKTPDTPTRWTTLLADTSLKNVTVFVTILLVCGVVGILIPYCLEHKEVSELRQAVSDIRKHLKSQNVTTSKKSDRDIVIEAIQRSDHLATMNKRNLEMSREINKVIELINAGWEPRKGHLYLFNLQSKYTKTYNRAQEDCEQQNALLVVITDDDEQDFVEQRVKHIDLAFWIGLHKIGGHWEWVNGDRIVRAYWAKGHPPRQPLAEPECVEIRGSCNEPRKCWYVVECKAGRKWICEMEPDRKLLA